jgi:predicted nucleotidyltransferase
MLEALISSKTRVKLLDLFLLNPGSEYYLREIVRMTGENYNAVRRELANLESFGLISGQKKGNQQYFTVNRNFFLYDELQKIVLKSEGVAQVLREHLVQVSAIRCMFIYGSFARGEAGEKSDIDLFIVGDVEENDLLPLIRRSEEEVHREINYTLMRAAEFKDRKSSGDPFVTNVLNEKRIIITGTCDD